MSLKLNLLGVASALTLLAAVAPGLASAETRSVRRGEVRAYGLVGIAFGTVLPVLAISGLVLFPAACRRVELPVIVALRRAVWPALGPAAVPCLIQLLVRDAIGTNAFVLGTAALAAGLLYAAGFLLLAIGRDERRWYLAKISDVRNRPRIRLA